MANPILLKEITTPDKAKALFVNRRPIEIAASSEFYDGNHWQLGKGWIGAAPTDGDSSVLSQIEAAFVSENVIAEVIDRHVAGVLGREPLWGFLPAEMVAVSTQARRARFAKRQGLTPTKPVAPSLNTTAQEADDALTIWWNQRRTRDQLKQALITALAEEKALIRFFVPRGLKAEDGSVPLQGDLGPALDLIHIDVVTSDKGGVFVDDDTQQEFGVYLYQLDGDAFAELTYVDDSGQTILAVLSEKNDPVMADPIDLQGRLWMYEFRRKALVTEQVKSNQRCLNLALTMMMRNVNLAGSLERTVMNAERTKETVKVADPTDVRGYREESRPADYLVGPGATMFLNGVLIRNDNGEIIGRANPNISFRDPVQIDTFTGSRDQFYASILGQCQQRFALISGDAVTSGKSREQARGEYETSLKDTADVIEDAGRWILETPLRLAAQFCNKSKKFAGLRCDFSAVIETGPVSPEDRKANREDAASGLLSVETAMSNNGIDDTDAEKQKVEEDKASAPAPQPNFIMPNVPRALASAPPALRGLATAAPRGNGNG